MVKSKRSAQIRKAFSDILARRTARGVPLTTAPPAEIPTEEKPAEESAGEEVPPPPPPEAPPLLRVPSAEEGWGPKKGELLEVNTPDDEWVTAVVIKEPLHRRWFHVYSPEFGQVYKRVTLERLRPTIYSIEGSQLTIGKAFQDKVAWEPKKGEEVLVHPDNPEDGDPAVATITKVPFHRRWYHLYQQETKQCMRRVPAERISKYNPENFDLTPSSFDNIPEPDPKPEAEAEADPKPEAEADPKPEAEPEPAATPPEEPAETAKSEASLIKGDIVYAMIAGVKERVAVLNIPEGYQCDTKRTRKTTRVCYPTDRIHRVPIDDIVGPVDDPKETPALEATPEESAPTEPPSLDLNRGDYVEAEIDGLWIVVIVTKVPKHRRWFHVRTMGNFEEEAKLYKRIPATSIRTFDNPDDAPPNSIVWPTIPKTENENSAPASSIAITSIVLESMLKTLREKNVNPTQITQQYLRDTFPQYASMINKSVWNVVISEIAPTRV